MTTRDSKGAIISLSEIGQNEFGLKYHDSRYCIGRAKNFLYDVNELARERSRQHKPSTSTELIARNGKRKL